MDFDGFFENLLHELKQLGFNLNFFRLSGDFTRLFALLFLLRFLVKQKSCKGISGETQILYALVVLTRYVDVLTDYISTYNSAFKYIYISLHVMTVIIFFDNAHRENSIDCLNWSLIAVLIGFCGSLTYASNVDPSYRLVDMKGAFNFSHYLEAIAIIPQICMTYKEEKSNRSVFIYILMLYAYRSFYVGNWIYRYYTEGYYDSIVDFWGIVQLVLYLVYFGVYWMKKKVKEALHPLYI